LFLLRKKGFATKIQRHKEKNFVFSFASQKVFCREGGKAFLGRQGGVLFCFAKNIVATKAQRTSEKTSFLFFAEKAVRLFVKKLRKKNVSFKS
jgi:hypothetical protein